MQQHGAPNGLKLGLVAIGLELLRNHAAVAVARMKELQLLGHLVHIARLPALEVGAVEEAYRFEPRAALELWVPTLVEGFAHQLRQIALQLRLRQPALHQLQRLVERHRGDRSGGLNRCQIDRLRCQARCPVLGKQDLLINHPAPPVATVVLVGIEAAPIKKLRLHAILNIDLTDDPGLLFEWAHDQASQKLARQTVIGRNVLTDIDVEAQREMGVPGQIVVDDFPADRVQKIDHLIDVRAVLARRVGGGREGTVLPVEQGCEPVIRHKASQR